MATPFCLKLLIDEEKNKVLFVEAGKDFVDVLLGFLTLPLGKIARLVSRDTNVQKVSFGSISSLYDSVANLEEKQFWNATCKQMLLRPRNSMEDYCQNLKFNIDDSEKMKYFICEDWYCSRQFSGGLLTTFWNQTCKCGKSMNREILLSSSHANEKIDYKGFVSDSASFIISDDLSVKPDSFQNSICLSMNLLGHEDFHAIKVVTVNVTQKELLDLLKCSLFSMTPLTDVFLLKKQFFENPRQSVLDFDIGDVEAIDEGKTIQVKVMRRKSNKTILFALGGDDFADFMLSLLTFPLGRVEHMLKGNACGASIDNLYKSVLDLDYYTFLRSPDNDIKDQLVKPQLAHQFKLRNQILPVDEKASFDYFCVTKYNRRKTGFHAYLTELEGSGTLSKELYVPLSYLEPRSSTGEEYSKCGGRGFTKRPSLYMVTDDLVVTPCSSVSVFSFLSNLGIPPSDLEERVITISNKEGLSLLKASLITSSALTNGLGQFLKTKIENISN